MSPPREERLHGGTDALDADGRDGSVNAPSHADSDVLVVDHEAREALAQPDQADQEPVAAAVADVGVGDAAGTDTSHEVPAPRAVPPASVLWVLGVVVATARYWFSHQRVIFHMAPDEAANLAMARWISGGLRWNMFDHNTWRPGMSVLMAPLFWFTDDTATIMHGGLLIGAALGGIAAVILARLAARLTVLTPTGCVLAAGAIAVAAPSLSATAFVWAEGVVTVTFLASMTLLLKFYDRPSFSLGAATVATAALGITSHSRLMPLLATVVALVLFKCLIERKWGLTAAVAAAGLAMTYASLAFSTMVFDHVWDDPASSNTVRTVVKRLPDFEANLRSALGQTWYQLVATFGLTAIGGGALVVRALRRRGTTPFCVIRDARLVLLVTAPLILVSIVFMSHRTRTDHRIYGRYNDAVLWPVLIVGIAWLVNLRRTPYRKSAAAVLIGIALAIVGTSIGIHYIAGEALAESVGVRPMVAGLEPIIGTASTIDITRVAVVSLLLLVVFVAAALASRRGVALALVALAFLVIGGVRTRDALSLRLNSWEPATEVVAIGDLVPPDATLGFRFVLAADKPGVSWDDQRRRAQLYQFALPHHRFERDRGIDDDVGPYVFAPTNDKILEAAGGKILWTDPKLKLSLWMEPPPPRAAPAS
jgi:hypothetical protein